MEFDDRWPKDAEPWMAPSLPDEHLPLVAPATREPLAVLLIGLMLFLGLLSLTWWGHRQTPSESFTQNLEARQNTYLVELLLYHTLRGSIPSWLTSQGSLATLSAQTGAIWEEYSRDALTPKRIRGLAAVDAAALYGAAGRFAQARGALRYGAMTDPDDARGIGQFLPLYAERPRPVRLDNVTALLAQLSAGPLIAARAAELRHDRTGAVAALQYGADAGQRVVTVNTWSALGVLFLLVVAAIIFFTRVRPLARAVEEAEHAQAPVVPWGIGTAFICISLTYLLSSLLASLAIKALHTQASDAMIVLEVLGTVVSAVIVLGGLLLLMGKKPWDWSVFGWRPTHWGIGYGVLVLLMSLPFVLGLTVLSSRFFGGHDTINPLIPELLTARSSAFIVFLVLSAIVMAPIIEETLFRGLLFRAANARLPFWLAATGSGILFALLHGEKAAILPIALLGTIFAFLTRRSQSLLASAAAHASFNGLESLLLLLTAWSMRGPGT